MCREVSPDWLQKEYIPDAHICTSQEIRWMTALAGTDRKFGRFSMGRRVFVGEVKGKDVYETGFESMIDLIKEDARVSSIRRRMSDLKVLAPVEKPSKIICVGLNYRSHIREMNSETPREPIIFTKPSSAVIGPGDEIVIPPTSKRVDYEGESAIVIGSKARITKDGKKHIFGYTCLNDVTARDLQRIDVDWTRAKGFDTFAPIGPIVSTVPPTRVTTRLNEKIVQDSPLSDRVFDDATLVEYISTIMTLEPGDMIATGTPSGISPMEPGDVVEVELDGIGKLTNKVVEMR